MKTQIVFKMPAQLSRALDEVDRALAAGNCDALLDFAECSFITVEGLEWLEELLLRAASSGITVAMTNVHPTIYKVFKVSRIDSIMKACGAASPSGPVC